MAAREDRGLGGAVAVDELRAAQQPERAAHVGHRERFAADEQATQARERARRVLDQAVEE